LANFSKEFYHWLAVSHNEAQRDCVWPALIIRKPLLHKNLFDSKIINFWVRGEAWVIHVVVCWLYIFHFVHGLYEPKFHMCPSGS